MTKTVTQLFDDLIVRFIINSPIEELSSIERLGFLVEQAFWYYDDFYYDQNQQKLPRYSSLKAFAIALHQHCPEIFPFPKASSSFEQEFSKFLKYKSSIPVVGAVLLDEAKEKVLLVQGYHAKSNVWTFPKGKINQHEKYEDCARREIYEETSFEVGDLLVPEHYIELVNENQLVRLYIIQNVPVNSKFFPRTRKEIKDIRWFSLQELFANKPANISIFLDKLKRFFKVHFMRPQKNVKESLLKALKSSKKDFAVERNAQVDVFRKNLIMHLSDLKCILANLNDVSF